MTVASMTIAKARPTPNILMKLTPLVPTATKVTARTAAAAVTMRPVFSKEQGEERADRGDDRDGQGQRRGQDAAEHQDEQHQGRGYSDRFRPGEVGLDLLPDGCGDRLRAAHSDGDGTPFTRVGGLDAADDLVDLVVAGLEVDDNQSGVACVVAKRHSPAQRPVRRCLGDVRLGREGSCQGHAGSGHGRIVDAAVRGVDEQDELGVAGAQVVLEVAGGPIGLRARILEPARREVAEHPDTDAGDDDEQSREPQDRTPATDREPSKASEHERTPGERGWLADDQACGDMSARCTSSAAGAAVSKVITVDTSRASRRVCHS